MSILLKVKSILLEYIGNRKYIEVQKVEIQKLNKKIIKQDKIIFELRSKNVKLTEEVEKTKNNNTNTWNKFDFYDNEIEEEILKKLSIAKKEVNIAMAWLTSNQLIKKLEYLKRNGIIVNLVVDDNKDNKIDNLKKSSTNLEVIKLIVNNEKKIMHNKYCIIDNRIVIDGSYNWSKSAKSNEEHIIVVESEIVAKMYKENFNRLMNSNLKNINILVS